MAKSVGKRELRKHLEQLTREQLVQHLITLNDSFTGARDYLQNVVDPDSDATVRERYRDIIEKEFFPARGLPKLRISVARAAVADYRKIAAALDGPADLMLYYVEAGVRFVNVYGDIDEQFYTSMGWMYGSAVEWMLKHGLTDEFRERCEQLVIDTRDFGYGFHELMAEMYEAYVNPDQD